MNPSPVFGEDETLPQQTRTHSQLFHTPHPHITCWACNPETINHVVFLSISSCCFQSILSFFYLFSSVFNLVISPPNSSDESWTGVTVLLVASYWGYWNKSSVFHLLVFSSLVDYWRDVDSAVRARPLRWVGRITILHLWPLTPALRYFLVTFCGLLFLASPSFIAVQDMVRNL